MKTRLDRQVVLKLGTDVRLTVDYYNARVAVWEPLVEEGCLRLGLEVLSGDGVEGRVKQRAIAISDFSDSNSLLNGWIMLNVTDACMETIARGVKGWKRVRGDVGAGAEIDEHSAALLFAKKGRVSEKENEKPFLLRNRCGVPLCFVPENRTKKGGEHTKLPVKLGTRDGGEAFYAGLEEFDSASVVEVADGGEAMFDLDVLGSGGNNDRAKVRAYDSKLPTLAIALDPSLKLAPLFGLAVSRVGVSVKEARAQAGLDDGVEVGVSGVLMERGGGLSNATANTLVSWSVELFDNRRILTLSSAVKIETATASGLPMEIGVKSLNSTESEVIAVGVLTPEEPLLLPLWLNVNAGEWDVLVRPTKNYNWSDRSLIVKRGASLSANGGEAVVCRREGGGASVYVACCDDVRENAQGGGGLKVFLYSSLSISNFLPVELAFQIVDGLPGTDASSVRVLEEQEGLGVGELHDCFCFDIEKSMAYGRFKIAGLMWSDWVELPVEAGVVYCQGSDENGTPFTFGVRNSKKIVRREGGVNANSVEVFCDLWIDNRSGVDVCVGAPQFQMGWGSEKDDGDLQTAQAALSEIMGVLEVGEDAHTLASHDNDYNWRIMGMQLSNVVWEEVFE